jgi:hypothetical protein
MEDIKTNLPAVLDDGLADVSDGGFITGKIIRFIKRKYPIGRGEEDALGRVLCVYRKRRAHRKWHDKRIVQEVIEQPGIPFPKLDELLASDDGTPGEWQSVTALYLRDLRTAEDFSFLSGTTGGRLAFNELGDQTRNMRLLRPACLPVVQLDTTTFPSPKYGAVDRPLFRVVGWCNLAGEMYPPTGSAAPAAEPPPVAHQPNGAAESPVEKKPTTPRVRVAKAQPAAHPEPELDDSIEDLWSETEKREAS